MASLEKEAKRKAKEGDFLAAGELYEMAGMTAKAVEMYVEGKDYLRAAKACEKCGEIEGAALHYVRGGEFLLAGNCYRILREHNKAAHLYSRAGKAELAAEMYETLGEFKQAGECYSRAGRWETAGEMFEHAGDLVRAGESFEKKGSWLRASRCFEEARVFRRAAETAEQAGDLKRAARCYQLAGDPVVAAERYRQAGDSAEALRVARSVAEDSPLFVEAMRVVIRALAERSYLTPLDEKQLARFEARAIDAASSDVFCDLCALYLACEMEEEADRLETRVRAEASDLPGVNEKLATIQRETPKTSVESIEKILKESFDYEETTRRIQERHAEVRGENESPEAGEDSATRPVSAGLAGVPASERHDRAPRTEIGRRPPELRSYETDADARNLAFDDLPKTEMGLEKHAEQPTTEIRMISIEDLVPGFLFDGRYVIGRKLGAGGLGSVFLAEDVKLDERVALKVLRPVPGIVDNVLSRFKQEIRLTRKIVHPNVVRTYDFGECGNLCYVSMEYIEGRDLKASLRDEGAFALRENLRILKDVCDALDAAHRLGITHRDVKPQNILIDHQGTVKVIDFGIAKVKDGGVATLTEMFVGTPDYISPEIALGKPVDHRTDIYALGVVMYEMFCGKTPFGGGPLVGVLSRHIHTPPTPPRELSPSIPAWLEGVILRALAKDPDERYQTVLDLKAALIAGESSREL